MSFFHKFRGIKLIDVIIVFSFLGLVVLFFAKFLTGETVFAFKDLSRYFYPLRYLMVEQVKSGHWPLWNPYIYCGYPLLATMQICFFYPLSLIHYLLPFPLAFNYYIIVHYFLAALFMFLLLRRYCLARGAAAFGGIVFAFSGYLLSVSNMNTSLSSVIWLPLALLFWDRVVRGEGAGNWLAFALVSAVMLLGGEPTIIYFSYWMFFAYGLFFARKKLAIMISLAGAGFLAVGLCAVQLFPFIELTRFSDRLAANYGVISSSSFPPREILSFVFPYFFGNPGQFGGYTDVLLGPVQQSWLISPYFGLLPFFFIFFAFRSGKKGIFFWGVALFSIIMAFGHYSFLFPLVYKLVPGVSLIRYPVKYLFMASFSFAMLAALGFDRFLRLIADPAWIKRLIVLLQLIIGGCLIAAVIVYLNINNIYLFFAAKYSKGIPIYFFNLLYQIIEFNAQTMFMIVAYLGGLLLIVSLFNKRVISRQWLIGGVILLVAADLMASGVPVALGAPKEAYTDVPQSYRQIIKTGSQWRVFFTPELERENKIIPGDDYIKAIMNSKENFAANWHILYQLQNFSGYESIKPGGLYVDYWQSFSGPRLGEKRDLLNAASVRYIASSKPLELSGLKKIIQRHAYGTDLFLYENKGTLPKARFTDGKGEAKIISSDFDRVEIETVSHRGGRLVLADRYYPGWRCTVDRRGARIEQEGSFRSCLVPAGKHRVVYTYQPGSFFWGGMVSLATIFVMLGLFIKFGVDDRN
ncbi:MAG: YfhO family protein [Candidatus Margulisbacteria bacterium]|nr:YfhO family protein [Candidatus Margulisiibacteriota bacterium]